MSQSFEGFMRAVNRLIGKRLDGFTSDDFPDLIMWHDAWDGGGCTPKEGLALFLETMVDEGEIPRDIAYPKGADS